MPDDWLALFPLNAVLLPGGALRLRIFEPRYVDMVGRCLREDSGFVVTQLMSGGETGDSTFHEIGTLAKISDWDQYDDGLLGITAAGRGRVRIMASRQQRDGLHTGRVEFLPADPETALPEKYRYLARLLKQFIAEIGDHHDPLEKDFSDAGWVGSRLAELLPLGPQQKQACLELTQPLRRLDLLAAALKALTKHN